MSSEQVIKQTQCWIQSVIIEFDFCPFAKRELMRNSVYYKVSNDSEIASALQSLLTECSRLDSNRDIETLLLIFPNGFENFHCFLELIELANDIIVAQNYLGIYQIASFHPLYCFAESDNDDAANFTNRSPFPILHLLREASLTQALENFPNVEQIPLRNIEKARNIGVSEFESILDKCMK